MELTEAESLREWLLFTRIIERYGRHPKENEADVRFNKGIKS